MKKFLISLLLVLGTGVSAAAQDQDYKAASAEYAQEFVKAINDLINGETTTEAYTQRCEEIGTDLGVYMLKLSAEDAKSFMENFYSSMYYYCAQYGMDKSTADMIIESLQGALNGVLETDYDESAKPTGSAADEADKYARQMVDYIQRAMDGNDDTAAMEKMGMEMGIYLASISAHEVSVFESEFYEAVRFYLERLDGADEEVVDLLCGYIREQFASIFEMFY